MVRPRVKRENSRRSSQRSRNRTSWGAKRGQGRRPISAWRGLTTRRRTVAAIPVGVAWSEGAAMYCSSSFCMLLITIVISLLASVPGAECRRFRLPGDEGRYLTTEERWFNQTLDHFAPAVMSTEPAFLHSVRNSTYSFYVVGDLG